ncbi:uncharacterized protein LOC120766038 isoform X1 [Hirundo rustica]|uniref:uncharacterized protein LOC120766038 isoform X1 n=1 Tax=Hirundo rustica TaxID=43150 RepID=UPI002671A5C6|nr:uncharacterized protein LOC120766038 isoform X1 [Hirundo rustica]
MRDPEETLRCASMQPPPSSSLRGSRGSASRRRPTRAPVQEANQLLPTAPDHPGPRRAEWLPGESRERAASPSHAGSEAPVDGVQHPQHPQGAGEAPAAPGGRPEERSHGLQQRRRRPPFIPHRHRQVPQGQGRSPVAQGQSILRFPRSPRCWLCPGPNLPPLSSPCLSRAQEHGEGTGGATHMAALHIPLTAPEVPWAWQGPRALPAPLVTLNPSGTQGKGMHRG